MDGDKWNQAREAAAYVLDHLNDDDRFNVVLFSTGWRIFSNNLEAAQRGARKRLTGSTGCMPKAAPTSTAR